MISPTRIVAAGLITAAAIGLTAPRLRWPRSWLVIAAIAGFVGIVLWRAISNYFSLNSDFMPAISVADVGCTVAGGLGPLLVGLAGRATLSRASVPAAVGAVVGFVVNVVIL